MNNLFYTPISIFVFNPIYMKPIQLFLSSSVFLMTVYACQPVKKDHAPDPLVAHIDTTVQPGNDFFQYANGNWFKANPIAASEQSCGIFQVIQDTINSQILKICKSSALTQSEEGSNKQKIGDFYFSGMDSMNLNKNGITVIQKYLDRIDQIKVP